MWSHYECCTASRPDITMLEGSSLAIIFDAELTLRCSLPAHRLLLADETTLYCLLGGIDDRERALWDQHLP